MFMFGYDFFIVFFLFSSSLSLFFFVFCSYYACFVFFSIIIIMFAFPTMSVYIFFNV